MRYPESQAHKPRDFKPRDRFTVTLQFVTIFFVAYATLIAYFMFVDGDSIFNPWSAAFILIFSGVLTYIMNYNRDVLLATEFQNAIFASAISRHFLFSIIARRDGSIMFADGGVEQILADYSRIRHSNLQDILALGEVKPEFKQIILNSVGQEQEESVLLSMKTKNGTREDMVITIDPIVRIPNFCLIRARPYYTSRAGGDSKSSQQVSSPAVSAYSFNDIFNNLPVGLFYTDGNGHVIFANSQVETWLGYESHYFNKAEHHIRTLVEGPDEMFTGKPYEGKAKLLHANGTIHTFDVSTTVDFDEDKVSRLSVIVYPAALHEDVKKNSNVSQQNQSAMPLNAGMAQEKDLFEDAPIAIVRCDMQGNIIHVNNAFDELIQATASSRPKHILDYIAEDKRNDVSAALSKLLESSDHSQHVDVEFIHAENDTIALSIFANKSTANDLVTFYLVDVTDQKNLELRFAHSQKMQAVGQLAGGVAHDFNNLLTAMIGFCDLLLMRHPAGDQSFADIMQIKQNANRAANLVRQLLAFSRRQTLQAKNLDITEVLAELSNLIRRLIGENIELKMIHGRDLSMIKADQGQLEQVIINLAVNARDAMKNGGSLTIRSSNIQIDNTHTIPRQMMAPAGEDVSIPHGNYVLIEVTDTGTGIPKNVIEQIFEPFFSTKEVGSGTGLGLSTVYGIIKQTGGYIYVNSVEGKGTQFHIYFPALSVAEEKAAAAEVQEQNAQDLTGKETILLVEDETPVRTFASRALKNKGYTILEADCGEAGLDIMKQHGENVDLIITDVIMPGINGPTMVDKVSESFPNIRVIFMSGYAEDIFMDNYGSERSFNFLAKPFTLKQLAAKVKEVLTA